MSPSMIRTRWLMCVVLIVGTLLALWQLWPAQDQSQTHWLRVEPQLIERRLGLLGRVQAAQQITLAAPFDGLVEALPVRVGERVESGQIVAVLDTTLMDIRLREAQAELLKASRAARDLRSWESGPEVARALRSLATAKRVLASSQTALEDTRGLFERGIVARLEVDSLVQQVRNQQQELASAEEEVRQTRARGQGEQVRIAQMELANAQSRHDSLLTLRERKVLKAPFAGLVVNPISEAADRSRQAQVGQLVSQGMPLLELVDLSRLQVTAAVEEADLGKLREGMAVHVQGEGFAGHMLHGRVELVGLRARDKDGPGAWFDLVVALDTKPDPLELGVRLGMRAQVTVVLYRNERGIALPAEALHGDEAGGRYVVFRAGENQAPTTIPVDVSESVVQGIEVEGLDAGYVLMP